MRNRVFDFLPRVSYILRHTEIREGDVISSIIRADDVYIVYNIIQSLQQGGTYLHNFAFVRRDYYYTCASVTAAV